MCEVKANANFHGHELTDIPVINPGDWFGKTWLIEIGGSYSSFYLIVEAGSAQDAIDELADSEKYGHHIVVEDDNLDDYDPETCNYGNLSSFKTTNDARIWVITEAADDNGERAATTLLLPEEY